MPLHGQNILGSSLSAEGTQTFRAVDPATSQKLDTQFHPATPDEVDRALELADRAFHARQPRDPEQIVALLERIADEIEALGDELIERCGAETGLPAGRLEMERGRTCNQLRLFAGVVAEGSWVDARIDRAVPDRQPIASPEEGQSVSGRQRVIMALDPSDDRLCAFCALGSQPAKGVHQNGALGRRRAMTLDHVGRQRQSGASTQVLLQLINAVGSNEEVDTIVAQTVDRVHGI